MGLPLTLDRILRRASAVHGEKEVVSRREDGSLHRTTYARLETRVRRLAAALAALERATRRPRRDVRMEFFSPSRNRLRDPLQRRGFLVCANPYMMVSGGFDHPQCDVDRLRDHWWYQPLDTDTV
jgi:hypothetical protein